MAYIDLGDLRGYIGADAATDDALLQEAIDDAIDYINRETHRWFEASDSMTRFYMRDRLDADDNTLLHLDEDCLTVTELLNGDASATEIVAANYWLLDRNLGPPYHWIKLLSNTGVYWQWDIDMWVSVTGTWGFSATCPDDVHRACLVLAAYFYRQKDAQVFDITAIPEAGVITIPQGIPATVTKVIAKYRKRI